MGPGRSLVASAGFLGVLASWILTTPGETLSTTAAAEVQEALPRIQEEVRPLAASYIADRVERAPDQRLESLVRVLDRSRRPLAGVKLVDPDSLLGEDAEARPYSHTDSEGLAWVPRDARVLPLLEGWIPVSRTALREAPQRLDGACGGAEEVEIRMARPARLRVIRNGWSKMSGGSHMHLVALDGHTPEPPEIHEDGDLIYAEYRGLRPGWYRAEGDRRGRRVAKDCVLIQLRDGEEASVRLDESLSRSRLVLHSSGAKLDGETRLLGSSYRAFLSNSYRTDPDFDDIPAGEYLVRIRPNQMRKAVIERTIVVSPGAEQEVDLALPSAGVEVMLRGQDGAVWPHAWAGLILERADRPQEPRRERWRGRRQARFDYVERGDYRLHVEPQMDFHQGRVFPTFPPVRGIRCQVDGEVATAVEVPWPATGSITVPLPDALRAEATPSSSCSVPDLEIVLRDAAGTRIGRLDLPHQRLRSHDELLFDRLPTGDYRVDFTGPRGGDGLRPQATASFHIEAGESGRAEEARLLSAKEQLARVPIPIQVHLLGRAGLPVEGAHLRFEDPQGKRYEADDWSRPGRPTQEFRLPPGEYTAVLWREGGDVQQHSVHIDADTARQPLLLRDVP